MDALEEKLGAFLSDPAAMEQVMNMARALGLGTPPEGSAAAPSRDAASPAPDTPPDDPMLRTLLSAVASAGADSGRENELFRALRPYVRPERREKLERAARVARLARIAGAALRGLEHPSGGG